MNLSDLRFESQGLKPILRPTMPSLGPPLLCARLNGSNIFRNLVSEVGGKLRRAVERERCYFLFLADFERGFGCSGQKRWATRKSWVADRRKRRDCTGGSEGKEFFVKQAGGCAACSWRAVRNAVLAPPYYRARPLLPTRSKFRNAHLLSVKGQDGLGLVQGARFVRGNQLFGFHYCL